MLHVIRFTMSVCGLFLQDWVVGKYGRVLPVVHLRRKDKKKVNILLQNIAAVYYNNCMVVSFLYMR